MHLLIQSDNDNSDIYIYIYKLKPRCARAILSSGGKAQTIPSPVHKTRKLLGPQSSAAAAKKIKNVSKIFSHLLHLLRFG